MVRQWGRWLRARAEAIISYLLGTLRSFWCVALINRCILSFAIQVRYPILSATVQKISPIGDVRAFMSHIGWLGNNIILNTYFNRGKVRLQNNELIASLLYNSVMGWSPTSKRTSKSWVLCSHSNCNEFGIQPLIYKRDTEMLASRFNVCQSMLITSSLNLWYIFSIQFNPVDQAFRHSQPTIKLSW